MRISNIQPINYVSNLNFRGRIDTRPNYDTYDSFTGLKDKNALLTDIGRRMYKKENISIGMFDMDNFKSVNELLGYKTGDEFIKAISESIINVADKHKIDAYRYGGDEFVVLLFKDTSQKEKEEVVNDILKTVSENPIIQGRSEDYMKSASSLLSYYEQSNEKVKSIMDVNSRYNILTDIWNNSTIAREDPYVQSMLNETYAQRHNIYFSILQESIETEKDPKIKKSLSRYQSDLDSNQGNIDEYILGRYDKNHEIYRLKRWIKDFEQNGFSLTGGIISFKPSFYKGKQPIDLIDNVGEFLKQGKSSLKGRAYTMEVE